jgi:hypothetical protein
VSPKQLTEGQVAEYFQRSYTSVDGLWFMKVEERDGFDAALKIDNEVWKVLPKIQARKLKSLLKAGEGIDGLCDCLTNKLKLEGFEYAAKKKNDALTLAISECPWHKLLLKSGREHLFEQISKTICQTEYSVWASEFGDIQFTLQRTCTRSDGCRLCFSPSK